MKPIAVLLVLAAMVALRAQGPRRTVTMVIVGGTVITQDATRRILSPGAIAIDGNAILAVDTPERISAAFNATETITARDQVERHGHHYNLRVRSITGGRG